MTRSGYRCDLSVECEIALGATDVAADLFAEGLGRRKPDFCAKPFKEG